MPPNVQYSDRHPTLSLPSKTDGQKITTLRRSQARVPVRWSALFSGLLLIGNLAICSSFELYAVVAFKGVGASLPTEITEIRDRHRTRRHLLLAIGGGRVRDQLLANHAGDRQRKFRPGVLVSTMRLKAGALLRSHLVEPHIGVALCHRTAELSHAGPRTQTNPRLPGKSRALPGVGCSDLVSLHHSQHGLGEPRWHTFYFSPPTQQVLFSLLLCKRQRPREIHA